MNRIFIFGLGYSATRIAASLGARNWEVLSTGKGGMLSFEDEGNVQMALADASHVLSSVPPGGDGTDPVLERYGDRLGGKWLGYLSSTGVYGDSGGAWVDESAPTGSGRRTARTQCDASWRERDALVFRLPGIYGPQRSALDRVRQGKARRIDTPGQVFSRIHVDDIASAVLAAIIAGDAAPPGAYNLADDQPCHQNRVIEEACRLLDVAPPALQSLDDAGLNPIARAFYSENRRIANGKAKRVLGWKPAFPDYSAGLRALSAIISPANDRADPEIASVDQT